LRQKRGFCSVETNDIVKRQRLRVAVIGLKKMGLIARADPQRTGLAIVGISIRMYTHGINLLMGVGGYPFRL
jgi:hypothetical protein